MDNPVKFKYASNGIEQSIYAQPSGKREDAIAETVLGDYIIDASAKSLITHRTEYPFMQLSDDYTGDTSSSNTGLSVAGAEKLYKEIIKDEESVALAVHQLADSIKRLEDEESTEQSVFDAIDASLDELANAISDNKAVYEPSDSIPSTMSSTTIGNLSSKTPADLQGKSFSTILDQILYKETASSVNYNANSNSVSTAYVELNSDLSKSLFSTNTATITAYYVNGKAYTASWKVDTVGELTKTKATTYGSENVISVTFKFTVDENTPKLTTSFGNTGTTQLASQSKTVNGAVSTYLLGYYVVGAGAGVTMENDIAATFGGDTLKGLRTATAKTGLSNMQVLSAASSTSGTSKDTIYSTDAGKYFLIGTWGVNGLANSSYVYALLPAQLKVTAAYIRDAAGTNEALAVWGQVSDKMMSTVYTPADGESYELIPGFTNGTNKYNVWYFGKSGLNADGTITPNQDALKIVIAKA